MRFLVAGCVATLFALGVARADTAVFSDNFDGEGAPGASVLNYGTASGTSFAQWTISDGTVDLVAIPDVYGIASCPGSASGKCVDLDGSTHDAGVMTSKALTLGPGTYVLSFQYEGNERSGSPDSFSVALGGLFNTGAILVSSSDPVTTFTSAPITVLSSTTVSIIVGATGGDNIGPLFDNVSLVQLVATTLSTPEPTTWTMMIAAFGFLGMLWRRRTAFG